MSAENPGRRLFFRRVVGTALAIAAAPKLPTLPTLSALAPIIEIGEPLRAVREIPSPQGFPVASVGEAIDLVACLAHEMGIPVEELRGVLALCRFGLSPDYLQTLLWRLQDDRLTDWTHHALALSEVGKP